MFHFVCVHPFGKYTKGQVVTDMAEISLLAEDRDHHFVRVQAPPQVEDKIVVEENPEEEFTSMRDLPRSK